MFRVAKKWRLILVLLLKGIQYEICVEVSSCSRNIQFHNQKQAPVLHFQSLMHFVSVIDVSQLTLNLWFR